MVQEEKEYFMEVLVHRETATLTVSLREGVNKQTENHSMRYIKSCRMVPHSVYNDFNNLKLKLPRQSPLKYLHKVFIHSERIQLGKEEQ